MESPPVDRSPSVRLLDDTGGATDPFEAAPPDRHRPTATPLRVATFNLLHGMALRDGAVDRDGLRAAAGSLDADVVGLQEVDRHQSRSGGLDQTSEVAQALGAAHWIFVPAVVGTPGQRRDWVPADDSSVVGSDRPTSSVTGPTYGVGLVSRWPVREWDVLRFAPSPLSLPLLIPGPRPRFMRVPDEPRVAIAAVVDGPAGPLTVVTAHLSFVPGTNVRQLRRLAAWSATFPGPRLLIGDFNLPGPIPPRVTGWEQLARTPTYPSYRPRIQFDHVLGSGIGLAAVTRVRATGLGVSDHCALVVDLGV